MVGPGVAMSAPALGTNANKAGDNANEVSEATTDSHQVLDRAREAETAHGRVYETLQMDELHLEHQTRIQDQH